MELRKLLLAALVVGLQPLGTSSQLVGCWVLLMASVLVMSLLLPWQPGRLSQLHMLASSALAFGVLLNLMLVDPGFLRVAKERAIAVEVLMLMLLLGVPLLLLVLVLRRGWIAFRGWLLHEDGASSGHGWSGVKGKVRAWGRTALGLGAKGKGNTHGRGKKKGGREERKRGRGDEKEQHQQRQGQDGVRVSKRSGLATAAAAAAAGAHRCHIAVPAAAGRVVEGSPGSSSESYTLAKITARRME